MHIFHPTDFSAASDVAFMHALKLVLATRGYLTIFHFAHDDEARDDAHEFPQVRQTLARWNLLPPDVPREAVTSLGIRVRKVLVGGDDPTEAILGYLKAHPADLLVLGTHQRAGAARWLSKEVAAPLTREAAIPALFVPPHTAGFVDAATGTSRLRRVLVPVDRHPHPHAALELLPGFITAMRDDRAEVQLVHIGDESSQPHAQLPSTDDFTSTYRVVSGDVVGSILEMEAGWPADLVVMTTQGRRGFLEGLFGSTTEVVVRRSTCPILTVPAALTRPPAPAP